MAGTPKRIALTHCDECGAKVLLTTEDADGDLEGAECDECGYYVTRYTEEFSAKADWL